MGALLRRRRKETGLTQEEVGRMIGKSKSVVSQYETGVLNITFEMVQKYCNALGITIRELFFSDEDLHLSTNEVHGEIMERIIRKVQRLSDDDKKRLLGYIDALGDGLESTAFCCP